MVWSCLVQIRILTTLRNETMADLLLGQRNYGISRWMPNSKLKPNCSWPSTCSAWWWVFIYKNVSQRAVPGILTTGKVIISVPAESKPECESKLSKCSARGAKGWIRLVKQIRSLGHCQNTIYAELTPNLKCNLCASGSWNPGILPMQFLFLREMPCICREDLTSTSYPPWYRPMQHSPYGNWGKLSFVAWSAFLILFPAPDHPITFEADILQNGCK